LHPKKAWTFAAQVGYPRNGRHQTWRVDQAPSSTLMTQRWYTLSTVTVLQGWQPFFAHSRKPPTARRVGEAPETAVEHKFLDFAQNLPARSRRAVAVKAGRPQQHGVAPGPRPEVARSHAQRG
jgi:hypothetical protein